MTILPHFASAVWMKRISASFVFLFSLYLTPANAAAFDCEQAECGLLGEGAYPNLVLGTVKRVATSSEAESVFHWARVHGYWKALPDDASAFVNAIQIMALDVPGEQGSETITLLMGREHFAAIEIAPGDFVRYTPHEADLSAQPDRTVEHSIDAAYWNLFGCIAVLCRAEDFTCPARYRPGVFRRDDGVQLGLHSDTPLGTGVQIDTGTFLPRSPGKRDPLGLGNL